MSNFNFKKLTPFKWFVLENFPFIEADFDALTEWKLLCKLGNELNKVINATNSLGTQVVDLTTFVTNYFDNLDVQEEINNKLNEMAESGQLADIIAQYIQLRGLLCYDTIVSMKQATNIVDGSFCKTFGKTTLNDGLGRFYKVREIRNTDVIDEINIIALNDENLVAVLISEKYLEEIGDLEDLQTEDKTSLVNAINEIAEGGGGSTTDIIPFFCVLRATSDGWSILNDSGHEPLNVTSVEIAENRLIIHHDVGNVKVLSCSITPDEMFSKYGIKCGASVATNLTRIDLFMNLVANCYWRYISAQGGLVVQEGFSNLVQSLTWDNTKHCVHIVFDPNVAITNPTNWRTEFNNNLNVIATQLQRKLSTIYTADGALDVYMYDSSGNQITTAADFDRINTSYEINKAITPQTLVDHPISNSNLWVAGWLKRLPET